MLELFEEYGIAIFFYSILSSAFFSGLESAFLSINQIERYNYSLSKNAISKLITFYFNRFENLLTSVLIFNLFNNILAIWSFTKIVNHSFIEQYFLSFKLEVNSITLGILQTLLLTFIIILFCEVTPKRIGIRFSKLFIYLGMFPLFPIFILTYPIYWLYRYLIFLIEKLFKIDMTTREKMNQSELYAYIDRFSKGNRETDLENKLLKRLLVNRKQTVKSILIPRSKMQGFNIAKLPQNIPRAIKKFKYDIIVVYDKVEDRILGVLSKRKLMYKNALQSIDNQNITEFLIQPILIPENKKLIEVLTDMHFRNEEICLVTDEYSGVEGFVTYEDVVNKLLGKQYEIENSLINKIVKIKSNQYLLKGDLTISEFNHYFNKNFSSAYVETIGGYIEELIREIPTIGIIYKIDKSNFMIQEASKKKIKSILYEEIA